MSRSTVRSAVMQMIYEKHAGGEGGEDTLQMIYEQLREEAEDSTSPISEQEPGTRDRAYLQLLLDGVLNDLPEIDQQIAAYSRGWTLERMPRVDLTILRLATWEILHETDVPGSVVINEAVNLAKRYSEPDSSRFINGVLGSILRAKEAAEAKEVEND